MLTARLAVRGGCGAHGVVLIAGIALGLASAPALGQRLIDGATDSGWIVPAMEFAGITDSGDVDWNVGRNVTGGALVFRVSGFANEDRDAAGVADFIRVRSAQYTRTFNITAGMQFNADIVVPILLDGTIAFGGAANNSAVLGMRAVVELDEWDGMAWQTSGLRTLTVPNAGAGGGNQNVSRTEMARFANRDRGKQYRATVYYEMDVTAQGAIPGVPGAGGLNSRVDFDFRTPASDRGVVFSISAEPTGYDADSREALKVSAARMEYNDVRGRNARVGIVEVADSMTNHVDLPAARLTILNGPGAGRVDNDEHATAVASIIGSGNATAGRGGVAPESRMTLASVIDHGGVINAATAIRNAWGAGAAGVINYSASSTNTTNAQLDSFIAANDNITWVSSAGNNALLAGQPAGSIGSVPTPNAAYNNIAVGALESNFMRPTDFSSTTGAANFPNKPDVVAPGEYVLSASVRDLNNNGMRDDYTRSFVGATWGRSEDASGVSPDTGRVAGTSFAAPHVAGMVALLHEYSDIRGFDAASKDHRVMKALVIGGAATGGGLQDRAGNVWSQGKTGSPNNIMTPLRVTRSLDPNLGAGLASATGSLHLYRGGEARAADSNTDQNFNIDLRAPNLASRGSFWDLENVAGRNDLSDGTVDYFLGGGLYIPGEEPRGVEPPVSVIRAALTWDREVSGGAYDDLNNLELGLWIDGYGEDNMPGFDPFNPDADFCIAATVNINENVKLLDFSLDSFITLDSEILPFTYNPNFYLQVRNLGDFDTLYGLAVSFIPVPVPGAAGLLAVAGIISIGRRRR